MAAHCEIASSSSPAHPVATPDRTVADVAASQHGVVTRSQLLDAGLSAKGIRVRASTGRLHRLHRGVYAVGHTAPSLLATCHAALLACGPGAILCSVTAAVLWRLLPDEAALVHVARVGSHRTVAGVRLHRVRALPPASARHGLPLTTPLRTLHDLPSRLREPATDAGLALRLVRPEQVATADGFTRARSERRLLALVQRSRLPKPLTNAPLLGHEVDALWPEHRLVIEVDGYARHSSRRAFEDDRLRDRTLQAAGYRTIRLTWRQLTHEPEATAAALGGALAGRRTA